MDTIFFTGFPGFLGAELLPRILARAPQHRAVCLVQPKFSDLAHRRAKEITAARPELAGRIELLEGDITTRIYAPTDGVTQIWHLAAVYDLMVPREAGMRVNVEGTRNMLDFAERCRGLERFQYVSTCYVSGRYEGRFLEDDLEKGQHFNNFYEETKYLAEVDVRERMRAGLRATIYRPAIVVGDSASGATQKYDGPYFVIQWLLRQPRVALLPVVGRPSRYYLNLVPRDFVMAAIERLSGVPISLGKTYHLADPDPLTVDETIKAIGEATDRRVLRIPLPLSVAKASLDSVPGVYRLLKIPSASVDYFVHPTIYDTRNSEADLAGSGISVPRLRQYLPRLIGFFRAHPEVSAAAMV